MEIQFIDKSISTAAVNKYYRVMADFKCDIHTLQVYIGGKQVIRIGQHPYSCDDKREIFSLSKTFAASVVGCAVDRGYLTVEDKVLDIFPEIETDNEYFKMLRVRHVLSMNTGHAVCVMPYMSHAESAVKGFFSVEPKFEPGTHFTYNTGATCLLAAIVERVTGERFFDFACKNLFWPLGITEVYWDTCTDGTAIAGSGLHASSDDIIKLFLMYANMGIYNGKRILSEEWIRAASSPVSDTSTNGDQHWIRGYGYQTWQNDRDGYRGDGAFGQLGMVIPKYDAVVAVQGNVSDMNDEIEGIFRLLEDITTLSPDDTEPDFYHFEPLPRVSGIEPFERTYELEPGPQGFKYLRVNFDGDRFDMIFSDGKAMQKISAGNGEWVRSEYRAKHMHSTITELIPTCFDKTNICEGCMTLDGDMIVLRMRYHVSPFHERYDIKLTEDTFDLNIEESIREEKNRHFVGRRV